MAVLTTTVMQQDPRAAYLLTRGCALQVVTHDVDGDGENADIDENDDGISTSPGAYFGAFILS